MQCDTIFKIIDEISEHYVDVLEDVCNIESPTDFKDGVDKVGEYFIKMAQENGFKTEVFEQKISGNAVMITMNEEACARPACISAHLDTVHPIGSFGSPPVKRDAKRMYGPGVMDCKGGAVAAFCAMVALKKAGFTSRPVKLILQSDEENSSKTSNKETIEYMCHSAEGAECFLNLEGYVKNTVVLVRKGILRYKFKISGRALHSSVCFNASNAVLEAAHKIIELEKFKDPNGITCNCGVISGGTVPNSVAEACEFYADIRFKNDEELNSIKEKVKEIAEKTFVKGCSCELIEVSLRPAMPESKKNENLLLKMNEIYAQNGLPVLTKKDCMSGSDAAYITKIGVPCVDCIGTEGKNIHSVDEYIELASVGESAKRIASVIYCI